MSPRFACQGLQLGTTESSDERRMYLASAFQTNGGICRLSKGIYSDGKGALCCQDSGDFALELGGCLPNEGCVVDETVLRSLVLCLQGSARHDRDIMSKSRSPSWCVRNVLEVQCVAVHGSTWNILCTSS